MAVLVAVVAAIAALVWIKRGRDAATPATSAISQPMGSATASKSAALTRDRPARATITVRDDKGPIAGATVRLEPEDGEVVIVQTGADGLARAEDLAAGEWTISGSAPGHQPAALAATTFEAGADDKLEIVLAPGGRILSGTISDATGGPIRGARIDAAKLTQAIAASDAVASTSSDADGKYQLTVEEGQLVVAASNPEYAPQSRHVEVGASGATADFALVPGGVIEGVVLDQGSRAPVPGAIVRARRDSGGGRGIALAEPGVARAVAKADGKFRIAGLRPGAYELDARAGKQFSKTPTVVGLGVAEAVIDVELPIGTGPIVSGVVVDETGAPAAGVRVTSDGDRGGVESDDQGAFVLEALPPGRHRLRAMSDDMTPAAPTAIELNDKDITGVKVMVRRALRLVGHVEPRQVCEIEQEVEPGRLGNGIAVLHSPVTTAADGEFTFKQMQAGKATFSANCPSGDQGSLAVDLTPGMSEVVLKVTAGASITGRVVQGDGKPAAGVTVMAAEQGPSSTTMIINGMVTSGAQALVSLDGRYEIRGLAAATYRLSVLDGGKPVRMAAPVETTLAAAERKTGVDLAITRANGVIRGIVTGPDGKPLADAWVSARLSFESMIEGLDGPRPGASPNDRGREERSSFVTSSYVMTKMDLSNGGSVDDPPALTDEQGRFEISGLAHGSYLVTAEAQAGKLRGQIAGVKPDATLTIQALGVTSLSGTVRGLNGPAALFTLELEGPTRAARTFTGGTFTLPRVDPGSYTVRVSSADGNGEAKVQVTAGQPATVDIVLAANAVVVGKLVDAAGKPLAGVMMTVVPDPGDGGKLEVRVEGEPTTTGPDGAFRLEADAGERMVFAFTRPRPTTKRGLTLEPGKTHDIGELRMEPTTP
ncbi:MAG: carboxypeptidase regulatory-like domain-containing protein [Kofleriaceae bacterium]